MQFTLPNIVQLYWTSLLLFPTLIDAKQNHAATATIIKQVVAKETFRPCSGHSHGKRANIDEFPELSRSSSVEEISTATTAMPMDYGGASVASKNAFGMSSPDIGSLVDMSLLRSDNDTQAYPSSLSPPPPTTIYFVSISTFITTTTESEPLDHPTPQTTSTPLTTPLTSTSTHTIIQALTLEKLLPITLTTTIATSTTSITYSTTLTVSASETTVYSRTTVILYPEVIEVSTIGTVTLSSTRGLEGGKTGPEEVEGLYTDTYTVDWDSFLPNLDRHATEYIKPAETTRKPQLSSGGW